MTAGVARVAGALCLLSAVMAAAQSAGQPATPQAPQRFQSAADLVSVDVLVTEDRQPIAGLTATDFEVLDNGVPQAVAQIYLEQLPVNVIMVLDTSGSVRGERLASLKAGAETVVARLRPRDRAALVSFSHRLGLPAALTADRITLHASISGLEAAGSTALRDAAYAGFAIRTAEATRTLLLVFSDGVDNASILEEDDVMEIAKRSDAIVYAVGIRGPSPLDRAGTRAYMPPRRVEPSTDDKFLTRLARETGGRLLYAERNRDLERTFSRTLDEFNSRYVLGYTPRNVAAGGWHRLEVRLKNRKGMVLARRGYFGE